LEELDWPEGIKQLQRNWIGRSTGADVDFPLASVDYASWCATRARQGAPPKPDEDVIRVYTTRPDTLFGATYMVLAPEHPYVDRITTPACRAAVTRYQQQAALKSDMERTELAKEKSGVFTGAYALNPVNSQPIPVWIADYVLASYGTGAIMAVPAHDERDFEFARAHHLPIVAVVAPDPELGIDRAAVLRGEACMTQPGRAIASGPYNGLSTQEFKEKITTDLAERGLGRAAVNYKMRDWLFSRQRFWGEPFPILYELDPQGQPTGLHRAVPDAALPVNLPELADFRPHGRPEPLLDKAPQDWLYPCIEGVRYKRETNTMPQWAGSCWYYLRFLDPKNKLALVDRDVERQWMPVDLYVGGAEHAVLHLLYARFWHKVLFDRGHVSHPEPFRKLVNQGMILGEIEITGYQDESGQWVSSEHVTRDGEGHAIDRNSQQRLQVRSVLAGETQKRGEYLVLQDQPEIRLESRAHKMSKSRGNVVNPDQIVREYGADSLRLYEMFMGPLEFTKPWSTDGVSGVRNFLARVWRLIVNEHAERMELNESLRDVHPTDEQQRILHRTIASVTEDTQRMQFNTAIARMMEFVNFFTKETDRPRSAMESFVLLLSPYAPHLSEELWQALGHTSSLAYEAWPKFDPRWLADAEWEVPIQIRGKLRGKIRVPAGADPDATELAARAEPRIRELLQGQVIVKTIVIPGKLVNFVTR
jgi:leucyl-tRNA synthetase